LAYLAQSGLKHDHANPLKGFGGVLEVIEDFKRYTYRTVYTVKLNNAVYGIALLPEKIKTAKAHAEGENND